MNDNGSKIDPTQFARQRPGEPAGNDKASSDKAGRASRQAVLSVRLQLADGFYGMIYGHQRGGAWMNLEATRIEIPFEGLVKKGGEWRRVDGDWLAVIRGRNLGVIYDHLLESKRISVHPSSGAEAGQPHVESVDIEELPLE